MEQGTVDLVIAERLEALARRVRAGEIHAVALGTERHGAFSRQVEHLQPGEFATFISDGRHTVTLTYAEGPRPVPVNTVAFAQFDGPDVVLSIPRMADGP